MSPQLIDNRLIDLRRRLRQALVTHGASWLAAVLVGSRDAAFHGPHA